MMICSSHTRVVLVGTLIGTLAVAACSGDPAGTVSGPPSESVPSATPTNSPPMEDRDGDGISDFNDLYPYDPTHVLLTCYLDPEFNEDATFEVGTGQKGWPDFTDVWAMKAVSCDIDNAVTPISRIEQKAYKISKYSDNDISILYTICAEVDPSDPYAEAGYVASAEQIPEINAALTLCPDHPLSREWRKAVRRGKAEADLEAEGRLFGSGTFLIGDEIKPGTYVTTDVEGCYWERQDKAGGTIDNDFLQSARRVEVTIRSSDYAFHSERCGTWKALR
jgi:hypothetical protein